MFKRRFKATPKNVIPAKAAIQKLLTSLDSRLRGSDKLIIIRGSLNFCLEHSDFENWGLDHEDGY